LSRKAANAFLGTDERTLRQTIDDHFPPGMSQPRAASADVLSWDSSLEE
jgi:hypothetical protein